MLNKPQIFNYLTLILSICTICASVWSIITKTSPIIAVVLMICTIIVNSISKKLNKNEVMLTVDDKQILKEIKNKSEEK